MGADDAALTLIELARHVAHHAELDLVEHLLVLPLGAGVGDRLADGRGRLAADGLFERTRPPLGRLQPLDLAPA